MAWYALYKWFIAWSKRPYVNQIEMYRKYCYQKWFDSLSEEDQQAELLRIKKQKEKDRQSTRNALLALNMIYSSRYPFFDY